MKCPIDGADLLMAERHGVEIDYCPTCRGIWLDRGELDKILEHVEPESGGRQGREDQDRGYHERDYEDERKEGQRHGRKRSPLSSFFEGFGGEGD